MGFYKVLAHILASAVDPRSLDAVIEQVLELSFLDACGRKLRQEMASPVPQLTLEQGREDQRIGFTRLIACVVVHPRFGAAKKLIQAVGRAKLQPCRFGKSGKAWLYHPHVEAVEVSLEDTRELVLGRVHSEIPS